MPIVICSVRPGKEVTAGLMESGCHVIMACRRLDRYLCMVLGLLKVCRHVIHGMYTDQPALNC